jgi:hypothetical protein
MTFLASTMNAKDDLTIALCLSSKDSLKLSPDNNIKGWLSIAVLDNKTSVICVGLANKYYSVKQYPKREDIPNQPPRHPISSFVNKAPFFKSIKLLILVSLSSHNLCFSSPRKSIAVFGLRCIKSSAVCVMYDCIRSLITGDKNSEFSLSKESYAGLSFKESLEDRQRAIVKSSFAFIVEAKNVMAENRAVSTLINNEAKKYKRRDDMFYNTQTKAAREYSYRSVDDKNNNIKGWLSIAVLDNKTSVICVGLANKYYSVKQYPKREDIPNQIPRHPNCRSMLVGVEYGERIQSYMTQTADDFMHRNPKTAIDFLGEEKHKLWLESETSINNFIDLKNGALFTNEEIERKFL